MTCPQTWLCYCDAFSRYQQPWCVETAVLGCARCWSWTGTRECAGPPRATRPEASLLLHCQLPIPYIYQLPSWSAGGGVSTRNALAAAVAVGAGVKGLAARVARQRLQAADGARSDGQQHRVCAAGHARQGLARQQALATTACALRAIYPQ